MEVAVRRDDRKVGRRLQLVTGRALLVAAAGMFIDAWAGSATLSTWLASIITPGGADNGSIGLIPAYLGSMIGMTGLLLVVYETAGMWPGLLAGVGVVGMFVFWGSYPDHSTIGGLGTILVGIAILFLPGWARFATPLWVASGILGITELVRPGVSWGPISGFTLGGAAVAVTGAFVLWSLHTEDPVERSITTGAEPDRMSR